MVSALADVVAHSEVAGAGVPHARHGPPLQLVLDCRLVALGRWRHVGRESEVDDLGVVDGDRLTRLI